MQLMFLAPLYKIMYLGEKELIIPFIIPFLDPESEHGFYINMAHQSINSVFGLFIVPASEILICVLKNNVCVAAAVIENSFMEFKIKIQENKEFSYDQTLQFQNIILKIIDFNR